MVNKALKKIIVFITVFMLIFSNCGFTLKALAATDGLNLFGFNLFGTGNMSFEAYFLDADGSKQKENKANVNEQATLVFELEPKAEGYLKKGTIKAVSEEEGDINFKIEEVSLETEDTKEALQNLNVTEQQVDAPLLKSELTLEPNKAKDNNETENNSTVNESTSENTTVNEDNNVVSDNTIVDDSNTVAEDNTVVNSNVTIDQNVVEENSVTEENNQDENIVETEKTVDEESGEEIVNEEAVLEEKVSEENETIFLSEVAKASVISENEIQVENIIKSTKVYVNISFKTGETLNIEDLSKKINLEFEGTYINKYLEEIPVNFVENLEVEWTYSKDIEVSSEYTKVSPFRIGETQGTIVENTITVKRDIEDEKYLPVKETNISLEVPNLQGNMPTDLGVYALKLKATKGEDINEVIFSENNWEYNKNSNTINIKVENNDAKFTYGEDVYIVTYRYDTYVEEAEVSLDTKGTVKVTEFSGKDNNEIIKNIDNTQKVIANIGELVTYSIETSESKIGKGKINANYNNAEEKYQSEFDTTVSVNILTNDVLSEFTLKDTKEFYIDNEGLEFETNDVKYKNIKFRYDEIQEFLTNDGVIEIKTNNGDLLYTLNKDLVKSDEDASIGIEGDVKGIQISFKNIAVNGNINIEFTKAIGKSSYERAAFSNFKKLESRINAVAKYSEDSEGTELVEIKTEKEFEESNTEAEIEMNKVSLSTTELNQDVEFKIELKNDREDSDLYINPVFEIVLPKYVKNIDLKATNILYNAGLSVKNMIVHRAEDGTERMRIELNGTQSEFSESSITNGTNIIINTNIEIDPYAPRKDEQIKLYYINEGVTNYTSQTKWNIDSEVPTGIIKTTNGFDSYVFKINAPTGFIAINEIQNYDGQDSLVSSIRQGEETREIEIGKSAQVARMNLIAINNTENKCTDTAFLGRIPVKGITDVKTGEKLETNINVAMLNRITEDENNPLSAKIYYSTNANADKNLNDKANGWTEEIENLSEVKSFLIVPDSTVEPGYKFKYTYEFVIPENLPYEAKIYGSFGAFFNNHSDVAITYESTSADLVGVITKPGPKVEALLSVDIGDGAEVRKTGFLDYTLKIINSGSEVAEGVTVKNPIPKGTTLYEEIEDIDYFRYGMFKVENQNDMEWQIEKLNPGEVKEFKYSVKVNNSNDITSIRNKAHISISNLALDIESNQTENKVIDSSFDIETYSGNLSGMAISESFILEVKAQNISNTNLKNVVLEYPLPKELEYESFEFYIDEEDDSSDTCNYEIKDNIFTINIPEWNDGSIIETHIYAKCKYGSKEKISNKVNFIKEDGTTESSRDVKVNIYGPELDVLQTSSVSGDTIKEGENVEFIISILNKGEYKADKVNIYSKISDKLEKVDIKTSGSSSESFKTTNSNELKATIDEIPQNEVVNVHISGRVKDVNDNNQTISSKMLIANQYLEDITTNEIILKIEDDPNRKIEKDQVIEDELNSEFEDYITENDNEEIEEDKEIYNSKTENKSNNIADSNSENNDQQEIINSQNSISSENRDENSTKQQESSNNKMSEENGNENNIINSEDNSNDGEINDLNDDEKSNAMNCSISGKIWLDSNKNGIIDEDENGISGVQVQLQKDNITAKVTASTKDGSYIFNDVEPGSYSIIYAYNENEYTTTVYKSTESSNGVSWARDLNNGKAITDILNVENTNIENINLGLKNKDKFDLTISKTINLAKVSKNEQTVSHKYKNLDLAKLEISAKDLNQTSVELHYKITIKNEGTVSCRATQIADYLPGDTTLDSNQSKNWYLGNNGIVYNDALKEELINPGETKTLALVLIRNMNEENTGVLVNKAAIISVEGNVDSINENNENNETTQELIISVRTGYTIQIVAILIIIISCISVIYLIKKKNIKIDFKKISIKKIYK